MKTSTIYPSNFLKASDIPANGVTVVIAKADMQEMGQGQDRETKLVLGFKDTEKVLTINKTNLKTIEKLHGDDTDLWMGKPIHLVVREVDFAGETTLAIRVSLLAQPAAAPSA